MLFRKKHTGRITSLVSWLDLERTRNRTGKKEGGGRGDRSVEPLNIAGGELEDSCLNPSRYKGGQTTGEATPLGAHSHQAQASHPTQPVIPVLSIVSSIPDPS